MARSINSPGVQITETDRSQYQQFGGGTRVFVPGFAAQGPTDEILRVTSISELEQIYGEPTTPAERYFYYTAKEALNSPASVFTSRLPYGPGNGDGFADQYSALFFPVASAYSDQAALTGEVTFTIGTPTYRSLSFDEYDKISQNNITWSSVLSAGQTSTTQYAGTSSITATTTNSAAIQAFVQNIDSTYQTTVNTISGLVTFTFDIVLSSTSFGGGSASWNNAISNVNAGFVICNASKTALNEAFEGYYLSITDNSEFSQGSDFTAVTKFYSLTGNSAPTYYEVPANRYDFALSGSKTAGGNSVSEIIENQYDWVINQPIYNDVVSVNLFKVRRSIYDPTQLTISPVENYLGSFNSDRKQFAPVGGIPKTFFLENLVNQASPNLKFFTNPALAQTNLWSSITPPVVRVQNNTKALYPNSLWQPQYNNSETKQIGNVYDKIQRVLTLIETPETLQLDVICDAGLSTIHAAISGTDDQEYDDTKYVPPGEILVADSEPILKFRSIFNLMGNFVKDTRKDCMYISDPLRQIFITGENSKTLSLRTTNFTTNIFNPLKSLYQNINNNYTAAYGNWIKVFDVYSDKNVWIPFSGCAAAIFARTDANNQPWFPPAGLNRGQVSNALDIAINPNQKQRDSLYSLAINPVVFFSGDGYVIFGQKTMQNRPSAFDRINVRRLFLSLERATQQALRYFVFEPNTNFTRTRLVNTINPIFDLARNTDGLYDYMIICDERNNTPDIVDRNELAVDIYIKPVKAAEFILVNFIATRTGQNFQEII